MEARVRDERHPRQALVNRGIDLLTSAATVDSEPHHPGSAWRLLSGDGLAIGDLCTRLARTPEEIEAAQRLRYRVFYQEMAARPTRAMAESARDFDAYDAFADHLLVFDTRQSRISEAVVGTYRLLREDRAAAAGGFYTSGEYDISPLTRLGLPLIELGRSCVAEGYRTRPTMELLWRGIAAYVFHHDIQFLFGCGSLPGTHVAGRENLLAYLHTHHLAPAAWRPVALPGRRVPLDDLMPAEQVDRRQALAELPPLIKGYLRIGGVIGDGAVIDEQFNTTDVCIIVRTETVTEKYIRHYARAAGERGA